MNDNQKTNESVPFEVGEDLTQFCKDFAAFASKQEVNVIHAEMSYGRPKWVELVVVWNRYNTKGGPDGTNYIATFNGFESNDRCYATAYLSGIPKES